jgi:hypothetical protein
VRNHGKGWAQIWQVPDVLGPEICRQWISLAEQGHWDRDAILENTPPTRSAARARVDAGEIFKKIAAVVPSTISGFDLLRVPDERMIFLRYGVGDHFGVHRDAPYIPDADSRSLYTMMIYLNDEFLGGETGFPGLNRVIRPKTGMALIFPHRVQHQGLPVERGIKYALHTFIVYSASQRRRERAGLSATSSDSLRVSASR